MNLPHIPLFIYKSFPTSREHAEIWKCSENSEKLQDLRSVSWYFSACSQIVDNDDLTTAETRASLLLFD